jgi:adenylate cyclase
LAPTELKNIHVPMDLYRVVLQWEKDVQLNQAARTVAARALQKNLLAWAAAAFFALAVIGGLVRWRQLKTAAQTPQVNAAAPTAHSVAVLPFVNMSPDKENEYLSDGITEDLCTALSQIKGLHVPARTSSFVFKGKTEDIRKIGGQLNVGTVLEVSVSKAGNKLRISAQLVNVTDGFHLWAANYDREMTDILDIRSDISRCVVEALKVQFGVEETQRLVKKPTETTEAYDSYLLGRYELNKFTEAGFTNAVAHFKHAMTMDPSFALATAGLAEAYNMLGYWNYLPPKEAFPEAKTAALQALKLNHRLAEAHTALAFVYYEFDWLFEKADHEFSEAVRLNPGSATARLWFAEFLLAMARYPEADEQFESARKLDPLSVRISFDLAVEFWLKRQFDRAEDQLQQTLSMDPANSLAYDFLGQVLWKINKPAEAFSVFEKARTLEGVFSGEEIGEMRKAYEASGLSAYLRKVNELRQRDLARGKYQSALIIALNYATAGVGGDALDWLEKAVDEHSTWLPELKVDPTWDNLRSQPRFVAVLKKIGLEK